MTFARAVIGRFTIMFYPVRGLDLINAPYVDAEFDSDQICEFVLDKRTEMTKADSSRWGQRRCRRQSACAESAVELDINVDDERWLVTVWNS